MLRALLSMHGSAIRPRCLLLGLALPVLLGMAPRREEPGSSVLNDFADPFVLRERTDYYGFATGARGMHLQAAHSRDLVSWTVVGDALPKLPSWAADDPEYTWAPSVLPRSGRYVLYYTARHKESGYQCISRALASVPAGPYVDDSVSPFVCDADPNGSARGTESGCGSIDPSPFVDGDGRAYLLWKSDENSPACHAPPHIWSRPLSEDGLRVLGERAMLLAMDEPWEAPIIEGPSMIRRDGRYYLFYSANWYDGPNYAIGYATCAGPYGPCIKATKDGPLVKSDGAMLGPGGQEFFTDASDRTWMAYHAWTAPSAAYTTGGARSLRLAPVTFEGGAPKVGRSETLKVQVFDTRNAIASKRISTNG